MPPGASFAGIQNIVWSAGDVLLGWSAVQEAKRVYGQTRPGQDPKYDLNPVEKTAAWVRSDRVDELVVLGHA